MLQQSSLNMDGDGDEIGGPHHDSDTEDDTD